MTIAVRYKKNRPTSKGVTVLIELPEDIRIDEDAFWDYAHEHITESLGEEPKWISIIGKVIIDPLP
jgi:hypothetical protein